MKTAFNITCGLVVGLSVAHRAPSEWSYSVGAGASFMAVFACMILDKLIEIKKALEEHS